jgi:hypothetical protein
MTSLLTLNATPFADTDTDTDATDMDAVPCRVCGCTDDEGCPGGRHWVPDPAGHGEVCSACRDIAADVLGLADVDLDLIDGQLAARAGSAELAAGPPVAAQVPGGTAAVLAAAWALLVSRGRHHGDWTQHPDGTGACCLTAALRIAAGGDPQAAPDPFTPTGRRYGGTILTLADRVLPPPTHPAASTDVELQESRLAAWNDQQDDATVLALLAETVADLTRCVTVTVDQLQPRGRRLAYAAATGPELVS